MEPLERAVVAELARFGGVPGLAPIMEAWPQAVGPAVARNAWPARLQRDGTLVVHTASATWAFELGHLEPRIRSELPEPRPPKLRFLVGPLPEPTPEPAQTPGATVAEPSAADRDTAEATAAPIGDENLRKVVAKTIALSLVRGATDRSLW
jgi:predicted nucleic acid-binding Zn ribbon protein